MDGAKDNKPIQDNMLESSIKIDIDIEDSEGILDLTDINESIQESVKKEDSGSINIEEKKTGHELPQTVPNEINETSNILEEDGIDLTVLKLEGIESKLDRLYKDFQSKLKYDTHKEKIINDLHQELQEYKNGIIKKQSHSLIKDTIKVIDGIMKFLHHYRSLEPSSIKPEKLIQFIKGTASDLNDVLFWQDVQSYTLSNSIFDPNRQRIIKKVETSDKAEDKFIAESLYSGYEMEGKVIRPEMVKVYIYKP